MKIELLDSAEKDLLDGFKFYQRQSRGLGDYFLDSLFSDIESLYLYAIPAKTQILPVPIYVLNNDYYLIIL